MRNKKLEAIDHAMGTLIAISHALDFAFGKGEGRIFDTWREKLLRETPPVATSSISKQGKVLMSKRFEDFLGTLPRKDS